MKKRCKSFYATGEAWKELPSVSKFQDGEDQKDEGS